MSRLIEAGALGAKTRSGVYRKKGNELTVLDPASGRHVEAGAKADPRVMLLYVAQQQALALSDAGFRPPLPGRRFPVAGRTGAASFKGQLINMLEGHFISA